MTSHPAGEPALGGRRRRRPRRAGGSFLVLRHDAVVVHVQPRRCNMPITVRFREFSYTQSRQAGSTCGRFLGLCRTTRRKGSLSACSPRWCGGPPTLIKQVTPEPRACGSTACSWPAVGQQHSNVFLYAGPLASGRGNDPGRARSAVGNVVDWECPRAATQSASQKRHSSILVEELRQGSLKTCKSVQSWLASGRGISGQGLCCLFQDLPADRSR